MTLAPGVAAALVVALALVSWARALPDSTTRAGVGLGRAIAAVARPGDTLVSAVGDAESVRASGLRSPYPYLWTLPAQVLDPHLTRLDALLRGPAAPTWVVLWDRPSFPAPVTQRLDTVVASRYRVVGLVCGRPVFLRDGVDRPAPPRGECSVASSDPSPPVPDLHLG